MEENTSVEKKRGGCITAFLIFMFVINPLLTIYYLVAGDMVREAMPNIPDWAMPVLAVFGLINLGLAIAIWKWKRIGVYGLWVSAVLVLIINLTIGLTPIQSFMGLLGPLIITLLVRPKWADFN
ncbi:MAG: hypothetical protein ACR2MM_12985 [Flavobacteriaceae bacterium]